jgi:hypothetical protein
LWPLWLHAREAGTVSLNTVVYYEPDKSIAGLLYRTVRMTHTLQVSCAKFQSNRWPFFRRNIVCSEPSFKGFIAEAASDYYPNEVYYVVLMGLNLNAGTTVIKNRCTNYTISVTASTIPITFRRRE